MAYFAKKYDRIRSIEKKKLARRFRQLRKLLETAQPNDKELIAEKRDIVVKMKYIKDFPKDQK